MKTRMESTSLGESKGNYTNSSVRQSNQKETGSTSTTRMAPAPGPAPSHTTPYKTYQANMANNGSSGNGKLAVGLLAGAGVGVLAGILLAPERGREMRKQLANSAAKMSDQMREAVGMCKSTMNSWTGRGTDGASTTHNTMNKKATLESNAGPDAVDKHVL